jgi:hypothetical protein
VLSLRDLQTRLAARLFGEANAEPIAPWIRADGIEPATRLDIYRNNVQAGFTTTLALEFPVVRRLVGEDYFEQLALAFLACHPSTSGDLHHVGAPFASFLRSEFAGTGYPYLPDVARLEWAYQECLIAEKSDPLDPRTLRAVPADVYGRLRFSLRPACRLVHSRFPVLRIWEVNQPEIPSVELVDLSTGPDFLLLIRNNRRMNVRRIEKADYRLLADFAAGKSLEEALELNLGRNATFDLGSALRRCFALGALTEMTYHQDPSRRVPCLSC